MRSTSSPAPLLLLLPALGCISLEAGPEETQCPPCSETERCVEASCVARDCGDGIVDPDLGETCDLGGGGSGDASCDPAICLPPSCGDERVQASIGEECDEGPLLNGARFGGCTAGSCRRNRCSDGTTDFPEESCDDGPANSDRYGTCTERCSPAACGDGVLGRGESCDGGDGCSPDCRLAGCGAKQVVVSGDDTLVLLDDGRLLGAGANEVGQLGRREPRSLPALTELFPGERFEEVDQMPRNGLGLTTGGALVAWGDNSFGQLGRGHLEPVAGLVVLDPGPGWLDVAAARYALFALRSDGALHGSGVERSFFPEGTGTVPCGGGTFSCVPHLTEILPRGSGIVALDAGTEHLVALDRDGQVLTWGCGGFGQLGEVVPEADVTPCEVLFGLTGRACRRAPTPLPSLQSPAVQAVAGWASTSWIDQQGRLFSLGANCNRALGLGDDVNLDRAREIRLDSAQEQRPHVAEVAPGSHLFTLVQDDRDQLWQFGPTEAFVSPEVTPPQLAIEAPGRGRFELAVGTGHALARARDGRVFVAGSDSSGQLGDGEPLTDHAGWRLLDLGGFCGCGDGVLDAGGGEACDDGPQNGVDAPCSPSCQPAACGDGFLQASAGEECDDGAANDDRLGDCTASCKLQRCGDGTLDPDEECDDGPASSDSRGGCTLRCTLPRCGDGARGPGEACDGTPGCGADCLPVGSCAVSVGAGHRTTLVILEDGRLLGFGENTLGGLGQPAAEATVVLPRELFPGSRFRLARHAFVHGAGIDQDGQLVTWGSNREGVRGLGDFQRSPGASVVDPEHRFLDVAVTDNQTFALREDGGVIGFGRRLASVLDGPGAVVNPNTSEPAYPAPVELVPPGSGFVALAAGVEHLVALDGAGTVFTWGCGSWGALGSGIPSAALAPCGGLEQPLGLDCRSTPAPVSGQPEPAIAIGATRAGTSWVDRRGGVLGAGGNCKGALGDDRREPLSSPVRPALPPELTTPASPRFVGISSGGADHALAPTLDGRLAGWGWNTGQLGAAGVNGPVAPRLVDAPAGGAVLELAAGYWHAAVLGESGRLFVSGANTDAQLGLGGVDGEFHRGWYEVDLSAFCQP